MSGLTEHVFHLDKWSFFRAFQGNVFLLRISSRSYSNFLSLVLLPNHMFPFPCNKFNLAASTSHFYISLSLISLPFLTPCPPLPFLPWRDDVLSMPSTDFSVPTTPICSLFHTSIPHYLISTYFFPSLCPFCLPSLNYSPSRPLLSPIFLSLMFPSLSIPC